MKKLLKRVLALVMVATMAVSQMNAATNDYSIEVKSHNFSKHSRSTNPLYGVTYTEENPNYMADPNWPLAEMSYAYTQSNYSYTLPTAQMVRQFGVSMGVVYWINPAENYIYWWNTVTGESGRTTPTKSYGVGYQDGINNPNFAFTFLGKETGSGAIAQDWYGNLVHMWNEGMNGWGTTAGTHFVQGYAVYKSATEYGKLMDFTPKLSKMNDTGRQNYPFYQRIVEGASPGTLKGGAGFTAPYDQLETYYTKYNPDSKTPNPNYPANEIVWNTNYDYHKANTSITKQPTDFLGVSGNLWGKGVLQGAPVTEVGRSAFTSGWSTGQVFHVRNNIAYGNMFADGQYTNWYLNYYLTVGNRVQHDKYPWSGLWKEQTPAVADHWLPRDYSFDNAATEYFFMESDVLEYFWSIPYAGLAEYDITDRGTYKWQGYVDNLNYSKYATYLTNDATRQPSDQMASPEIDSIKGTRVIVHNYWLQWMAFDTSDTDEKANKRNGAIMIQYSKYDGEMSTTSKPVFTGEPTRNYTPVGYAYGWAETDATTKQTKPTANFPVKFQNTTVNSWNELERINNNVFGLYTHVPGRGFAKYFITAVKPNNAVSGLSVSQTMNDKNEIVNTLTWTPQKYDRETMHTYEVWYRKKKAGASNYEDKKEIEGQNLEVWMPAGKASVKYTAGLDADGDTIYTSSYEGCTFEHIAPYGTDANGNYDRVYEYMIIPVYDASSHRGTESAVVTKTSKAPVCPVTGTFSQVTDKNDNGETLYGFSVKLEPSLTAGATGINSASRMVIVPQDETTATALAEAIKSGTDNGITTSSGTATVSTAQETFTAYEDVTVSGYHVNVTGFSVGDDGKLPIVTWHNINPEKEYKIKVYVVATASTYFTPSSELTTTLVVPELVWSTTPADFYKLVGDYGTLTKNEDMPIGSFRRIDPDTKKLDENPSNPVTLNNANYYGTNRSALLPVYVTDEVLGTKNAETGVYENAGWSVAYGIYITDENGKNFVQAQLQDQSYSKDYAACYSNVENVICDVIGMKVDYNDENKGEDGRIRKVYNPTQKTYKAKVEVAYRRMKDKLEVKKTTYTDIVIGSTSLPALGVQQTTQNAVLGALYERSNSHFYYNNANDEGYYPYYYDAAILFNWDGYDLLNRYMGYYGATTTTCYGHYENKEHNPNTWVQYHAGSVLPDSEIDLLNKSNAALTNGGIGYDGTNNWSALAIENNQVPMMIHYVHGGNTSLVTNAVSPASTETAVSDVKFDVTLTAEYPIVNYTTRNAGIMIAEDPDSYDIPLGSGAMNVMTVPTELTDMYVTSSTVTTGVEGILTEACGGVKLYPNPVGSTFTLEAPMNMNEVKIFSMDGQLVMVVKDVNVAKATINVDNLPKGVYIVNTLGVAQMMIKL